MNWIFENLQIVVVVAVVVVTLVGKLLEAIRTNKPTGGTTLEDLFGPDEEPEPMVRRPAPPPLRQVPGPPPLRQVTPSGDRGAQQAELERQRELQERLRKIRDAKAPAASAEVVAPTVVRRQTISGGLKGQLRSSKELRRAVMLREILGPPVGLR